MTAPTLPEFLLERITEDEKAANHAAGFEPITTAFRNDNYGHLTVQPTRVERECAAKRAILAIHCRAADVNGLGIAQDDLYANACHGCGFGGICDDWWVDDVNECPTLGALASVYAEHPDCRTEWVTP